MPTELQVQEMRVTIFESNDAVGAAAAADLAQILEAQVTESGEASIILATGNSQLSFMRALCAIPGLAWDRINVFHMDEYLGMSADHHASFRPFLHEQLVDPVHPKAFFGITGDARDIELEMARYASLLDKFTPIACVLGIGENGHLAFNDPPADFDTQELIHVVRLAEAARRQQVGEGHFETLADVPTHAISLTVPALLRARQVLAVVPEARKAAAVKAALEGPVTPECPASILKTMHYVKLYLDRDSAAELALS